MANLSILDSFDKILPSSYTISFFNFLNIMSFNLVSSYDQKIVELRKKVNEAKETPSNNYEEYFKAHRDFFCRVYSGLDAFFKPEIIEDMPVDTESAINAPVNFTPQFSHNHYEIFFQPANWQELVKNFSKENNGNLAELRKALCYILRKNNHNACINAVQKVVELWPEDNDLSFIQAALFNNLEDKNVSTNYCRFLEVYWQICRKNFIASFDSAKANSKEHNSFNSIVRPLRNPITIFGVNFSNICSSFRRFVDSAGAEMALPKFWFNRLIAIYNAANQTENIKEQLLDKIEYGDNALRLHFKQHDFIAKVQAGQIDAVGFDELNELFPTEDGLTMIENMCRICCVDVYSPKYVI